MSRQCEAEPGTVRGPVHFLPRWPDNSLRAVPLRARGVCGVPLPFVPCELRPMAVVIFSPALSGHAQSSSQHPGAKWASTLGR